MSLIRSINVTQDGVNYSFDVDVEKGLILSCYYGVPDEDTWQISEMYSIPDKVQLKVYRKINQLRHGTSQVQNLPS